MLWKAGRVADVNSFRMKVFRKMVLVGLSLGTGVKHRTCFTCGHLSLLVTFLSCLRCGTSSIR
jgi:hypothetical protein